MERTEDTSAKKRGRPRVRPVRPTPYTKVGQGSPLLSQSRELVVKVRNFFQEEKDKGDILIPIARVVERSAAALGINKNTVVAICKEKEKKISKIGKTNMSLQTPGRKRRRQKPVTSIDVFQQEAIRQHIYSYIRRKEHPTIEKLLASLRDSNLFRGSSFSLKSVLLTLGFVYKKLNRKRILLEKNDIVAWRCRFLREVKDLNFNKIVWLDETWVNTCNTLNQGTNEGTLAAPIGKGNRFILLHAGTSEGFVPNCCLLFASKKTSDYHEEMNHETFSKWFQESLLPNLSTPSVIVMDNAPHHSKVLDEAPTEANKKSEIQEWLCEHSIQFEEHFTKAELLELCEMYKPLVPKYLIDEMAKAKGHKIVRLPPYHCNFNAIEMIWAKVKEHVAQNNTASNLTGIRRLIEKGIEKVTSVEWTDIVKQTRETILEAWTQVEINETAVEELIKHLNGDDSDSETSDFETFANECDVQIDVGTQEIYFNQTYDDDEADDNNDSYEGIIPLPSTSID
ncbi:hypothetical protein LSTR_LSTR012525 [Laodelphax striatellus]|uniref:Tc1-like transposase DDE domain-containing protein n=1 Tax=Laodelphax striatellus TaxID=195883 RepID=A0A482XLM7_LAOST|nr:hypothetical protein LSTR_LSTR012525 [Laodelphax striatellus]